jgi:hypothetical protein
MLGQLYKTKFLFKIRLKTFLKPLNNLRDSCGMDTRSPDQNGFCREFGAKIDACHFCPSYLKGSTCRRLLQTKHLIWLSWTKSLAAPSPLPRLANVQAGFGSGCLPTQATI